MRGPDLAGGPGPRPRTSAARTAGAFNVAVEAADARMGIPCPPSTAAPTGRELAEARAAVKAARGSGSLSRSSGASVRIPPGSTSAASAWAMAWTGPAAVLRGAGIRRALLDVSGDCLGGSARRREKRGWLVEIADPDRAGRSDRRAPGSGTRRWQPRPTWCRWCPLRPRGARPRHGSGDRLSRHEAPTGDRDRAHGPRSRRPLDRDAGGGPSGSPEQCSARSFAEPGEVPAQRRGGGRGVGCGRARTRRVTGVVTASAEKPGPAPGPGSSACPPGRFDVCPA